RSGRRGRALARGGLGRGNLADVGCLDAGLRNIFPAGVRRRIDRRAGGRNAAGRLPLAGAEVGERASAVTGPQEGEGAMPRIGFIGLGNMGLPMAQKLIKAGHQVEGVDVVITMLPSGKEVRDIYLGTGGIIEDANPGTLLIDFSTIDVETARTVGAAAERKGLMM